MKHPTGSHNRLRVLSLLAIFGLALGLRLFNIDASSVWIDEIYSLMVANVHDVPAVLHPAIQTASDYYHQYLAWQPMDVGKLIALLKINVHMPLYYLLLNPWLGVFGSDVVGLRSFSALFSALMVLPLYALGKALGGHRAGLLAAFAGAVAPFQIYMGQEGRMYALTLFWATVSALSFWKTLHAEKPLRWSLLYALSTACGTLSHYMFVFFLSFQAAYGLWWLIRTRDFKRFALLGIAALILALIAAGWYPIYKIQQQGINDDYHFAKGLVDWPRYLTALVWQPLVMVGGDNNLERAFYFPLIVLLLMFYTLTGSTRWALPGKPSTDTDLKNEMPFTQPWFAREEFLLLWVLVPLLAQIAYDLIKQTHTVVVDRYVLLISPAMLLLLGLALNRLFEAGRRRWAYAALSLMLILAVCNVWAPSPFRDEHNKRNLRAKLGYMLQNARPDDLVFANGPLGAPNLAAYYLYKTRPNQPILYWMTPYRDQAVPLPDKRVFSPYGRIWLFRNRANNERGLQSAKEYLRTMYPHLLETEEEHDWWVFGR